MLWDFVWQDDLGPQARAVNHECTSQPGIYEGLPNTVDFYAALQVGEEATGDSQAAAEEITSEIDPDIGYMEDTVQLHKKFD